MIIETILKINPNAKVIVKGNHIDDCEIEWLEDTTPISKEDIKTMMPTVEDKLDALTVESVGVPISKVSPNTVPKNVSDDAGFELKVI